MIGKVIRLNRTKRHELGLLGRGRAVPRLRENLFALTRYIVDADPYKLLAGFGADIISLSEYALAVEGAGIEPGEKVEAYGVRNLYGEDLAGCQAEMLAVAVRARMESPVLHIILSLKEGESWSEEQIEEAIDIVLKTSDMERCQVLWAEHSNTKNAHLHLSIVRVDPETGLAAGSGWFIDDLHQALALIEERQGRTREPGALYEARKGIVYDADTGIMVRDSDGRFIRGWYKELGRKHDAMPAGMRRLRANIIHAAEGAHSWSQLHDALREIGVTYDRAGSGARMSFKGDSVVASAVHDTVSRPQLEKRLGAFEPDLSRLNIGYEEYRSAFADQLGQLRADRDRERARLQQWSRAAISALPFTGKRDVVSLMRLEAEAAEQALAEAFKLAIARCTKHRLSERAWYEAGQPKSPPPSISPALFLPAVVDGSESPWAMPSHLTRREAAFSTEYRLSDGTPLFTDHGIVLVVHAPDRSDGIDEALLIAAARWGSVTARGPDEYLDLVARRAAALGVEILDPEGAPLQANATQQQVARPFAIEPETPAVWTTPDLDDDPLHRARVDAAIDFLRRFEGLPIRRRSGAEDAMLGGRSGKFEIDLNDDPFSDRTQQLSSHAVFDEDKRVQEFLGQRHQAMLEGCRTQLLSSALDPNDISRAAILRQLPQKSEVTYPVAVAYDDYDFQEMLRDVRERILDRDRKVPRNRDALPPGRAMQQARIRERDRPNNQSREGASLGDQYAFQRRRSSRDL